MRGAGWIQWDENHLQIKPLMPYLPLPFTCFLQPWMCVSASATLKTSSNAIDFFTAFSDTVITFHWTGEEVERGSGFCWCIHISLLIPENVWSLRLFSQCIAASVDVSWWPVKCLIYLYAVVVEYAKFLCCLLDKYQLLEILSWKLAPHSSVWYLNWKPENGGTQLRTSNITSSLFVLLKSTESPNDKTT